MSVMFLAILAICKQCFSACSPLPLIQASDGLKDIPARMMESEEASDI